MMKTFRLRARNLALLLMVAAMAACARHRIIPDRVLADIFHDAFLTNAYVENRRLALDSTDIYTPIFEKYGYTVEDVQYTIGNFSKRKSARLGDVVEQAIKRLEEEGLAYEREVAVLDTIDNIARRTFRHTLLNDSLIVARRLADTTKLAIRIGNILPGDYRIEYDYRVDSLDECQTRRAVFYFLRSDSTRLGRQQQNLMKNNRTEHLMRTIIADTSARTLAIDLMDFTLPAKAPKNPKFGITVSNLRVTYTPTASMAIDSLLERQMPIRLFAPAFFDPNKTIDTLCNEEFLIGNEDEDGN